MPLVSSFWLSKKPNKKAWVEPVVVGGDDTPDGRPGVRFAVKDKQTSGAPPDPPKLGRGAKFRCLVCDQISADTHIKAEGKAGRMGQQLMAVVAEGHRSRKYLEGTEGHVAAAEQARPEWGPEQELANDPRNLWCIPYGLTTFADLFTPRQLVALGTFSDLVGEARDLARRDALASGLPEERAAAYADAVATYLAFAVDRSADFNCALTRWVQTNEKIMNLFARQAIPMVWDYGEANILEKVVGGWLPTIEYMTKCLLTSPYSNNVLGKAHQQDATDALDESYRPVISSDPPYYLTLRKSPDGNKLTRGWSKLRAL